MKLYTEEKSEIPIKLYTEEQVKEIVRLSLEEAETSVIWSKEWYPQKLADKILQSLKPIELPSDEEILALIGDGMHDYYKGGFEDGAKWMRDKIQGGNK